MKIALIGATGFVGSGILAEALDRGHDVTAIGRHPDKLPTHPRLKGVKADVTDRADLAPLVTGHDVVISAFDPGKDERQPARGRSSMPSSNLASSASSSAAARVARRHCGDDLCRAGKDGGQGRPSGRRVQPRRQGVVRRILLDRLGTD